MKYKTDTVLLLLLFFILIHLVKSLFVCKPIISYFGGYFNRFTNIVGRARSKTSGGFKNTIENRNFLWYNKLENIFPQRRPLTWE